MQGKVEICGVNTASLPVLSAEEADELLARAADGDREAREQFLQANLKLVLSVVQRFSSRRENMDDLFQVGCIGLIKALDRFDRTQEVRFSTYAVPMILGEIRRYLRDNSMIRVSRSLRDTAYLVLGAKEALTSDLGREPTVEEIAEKLRLPRTDIVLALEAVVAPISLSEPLYNDGDESLAVMDQVSSKTDCEENWVEELSLRQAMRSLSEREKRILALRFFDGRTQMEVSGEIGISQAQVSRLEKAALSRIKAGL